MPEKSYPLCVAYFLFFAILGIFIPYFNLYCYSLNFSTRDIGFLSASLSLMKLISPLYWAYLAEKIWTRKKISLLTSAASAIVFTLCLFLKSFTGMFLGITLYGFFRMAIIPLIDATTWEFIETYGKHEYGKIRLWGSVGFILASFCGGFLLDAAPLKTGLYIIAILSFLFLFNLSEIPEISVEQKAKKEPRGTFLPYLLQPAMFFFFTVCTLMQMSHSAYYGFFTIHMEELGYSRGLIGIAWSLSVLCEIVLLARYRKWLGKTRPEVVLIFACFVATWRWWITAYSHSLAFILLAQSTHAVTFAAFHVASLTYIHKRVPADLRTSGQSALSAISYGCGGTIGLIFSGLFYESLGAAGLFNLSGLSAFWGGIIALLHYFLAASPARKSVSDKSLGG